MLAVNWLGCLLVIGAVIMGLKSILGAADLGQKAQSCTAQVACVLALLFWLLIFVGIGALGLHLALLMTQPLF